MLNVDVSDTSPISFLVIIFQDILLPVDLYIVIPWLPSVTLLPVIVLFPTYTSRFLY